MNDVIMLANGDKAIVCYDARIGEYFVQIIHNKMMVHKIYYLNKDFVKKELVALSLAPIDIYVIIKELIHAC